MREPQCNNDKLDTKNANYECSEHWTELDNEQFGSNFESQNEKCVLKNLKSSKQFP